MSRLQQDTVDKLVELLSLPVGQDEHDERPESMAADIQRVSQSLGWLVFEDDRWFEYDPTRIETVLAGWLDDQTADQLNSASDSQPVEFLGWVDSLVSYWKSGQAGAAGPATQDGTGQSLGIENPNYEPHRVPGTEFYKYLNDEYVYAATADAPDDEWKALEARHDDYRVTSSTPVEEGMLQGYPYAHSVLPGTEYYRPDGDTYLYGPKEYGTADDWKPYDHWQEQADGDEEAKKLIDELDSFIALIEKRISQHR